MNLVKRIALAVAAPVLAFVIAGACASLLLVATGDDVAAFWETMLTWPEHRQIVNILNGTGILYLSGIAAAIGFRMNLFNIGVEGQYRIGTFVAAVVAGEAWLPGKANTLLAIVLAMVAGALWAGIAGILRVTRGVSEVISTIMLNAIAGLLVGYLIAKVGVTTGVSTSTKEVPKESWVGGITLFGDTPAQLYGLILLAVVVGIAFHVLLNDTRFGFNLRATGRSESAAVAAGVDVKRMVVTSMLLSGAIAGLIGMPVLFGQAHNYGTSFQTGHRLRRHRGRAAGPQQPDRDLPRRADLLVPRRAGERPQHPGRHLAGHRGRDPGHHRARRGHRLRDGPPLPGGHRTVRRRRTSRGAEDRGGTGMSVVVPATGTTPPAAGPAPEPQSRVIRIGAYFLAAFVLVSLCRQITGAEDINSTGALRAALIASVPILLAGLGGLWSERSGVVNIGLEGMMILGTLGAGYFGYNYGMVAGIVGAIAFGAIGGILHAIVTVLFGVDHIVSGVAINIIAAGMAAFLAEDVLHRPPGRRPDPVAAAAVDPHDHDRAAGGLRRARCRTSTGSWSRTSSRCSACWSTGCRC